MEKRKEERDVNELSVSYFWLQRGGMDGSLTQIAGRLHGCVVFKGGVFGQKG